MNKAAIKVLLVDDEADLRELVTITLGRMNITCHSATCVSAAKEILQTTTFDFCLTDMRLPDGNGLSLLNYMQKNYPAMPVAIITAFGSMETAITALKDGAFDFITKPIDLQVLRNLVKTATQLSKPAPPAELAVKLLGTSPAMQKLRNLINKLARSQAPIHIHGASGVGKELVAKSIHNLSPRTNQPFIAINCGAIPHELIESEFFGHKKGSFTGAYKDKIGMFQAADGGTLFLDEIGELQLDLQVKLLRAIQEKTIRPVGSPQETPINVRILSATNKNLLELIEQGKFREDLYYRINVIEVIVPSLQERAEDIGPLAEHILTKLTTDQLPIKFNQAALTALHNYSFPGNIRELENIIERALTLCENNLIQTDDLQLNSKAMPAKNLGLAAKLLGMTVANLKKLLRGKNSG